MIAVVLLAAFDFAADNPEWNGLSRFVTALSAGGVDVRAAAPFDLAAVIPPAGIALIGPAEIPDPAGLARFVQEGGRLLLADEGAASTELLARFGVRQAPAPSEGERLLGGHPALVIVRGRGVGPFAEVTHVVTNHPAGFTAQSRLEPVLLFADGTPFAYHLRLGAGEVVLMADASVFINLMQDAADNARLAAGLGGWLSEEGRRPVHVLAGETPAQGEYHGLAPPDEAGGTVRALNQALSRIGTPRPDEIAVRFFIALLLAATVLYGLSVFPGSASPRSPPPGPPSSDVERRAGRLGGTAAPVSERD